jgi:hypothetical protein
MDLQTCFTAHACLTEHSSTLFNSMTPQALFSGLACVLSVIAIFISVKNDNKSASSRFISEVIAINTLTIQYPELRKIYEPNIKYKLSEEKTEVQERLKNFCYKYLNLLDLINTHHSFTTSRNPFSSKRNEIKKDIQIKRIRKEIKRETQVGAWMIFYSKAFRPGIIAHDIMVEILDNCWESGDYSPKFVNFAKTLITDIADINKDNKITS